MLREIGPTSDASEAHFSPHGDCAGAIMRLIRDARERIDACVFTITDDRIADALLDAHDRGIALRILTDNDKANDLGSDIERLVRAGIELRTDRTPYHMHHKFAIFDRSKLLNGSYNWTRGAARDNQENIVITSDVRLVVAFEKEFVRLWQQMGR